MPDMKNGKLGEQLSAPYSRLCFCKLEDRRGYLYPDQGGELYLGPPERKPRDTLFFYHFALHALQSSKCHILPVCHLNI